MSKKMSSKLEKTNTLADQVIEKLSKATGTQQMQSQRRPINGLVGWSSDPATGALHHSTHGIIEPKKGPKGIDIKHGGKVVGNYGDFNAAGTGIRDYISTLSGTNTGMTNIPSNPTASVAKKEDLDKSNYGPKGMSQYSSTDNIKRKANNTGGVIGEGPNTNVKSYSTKPGQLSAKAQAALDARKIKVNSGPVKQFTPEQIAAENAKRGLKKGWGEHLPFPSGQPSHLHTKVQTADDLMANQLADMLNNKSMLGQAPPPQPTDEQMFGHLVTNPEELAKKEAQWGNTMNDFFAEAAKPLTGRFASEEEELAYWASIKIEDRGGDSGY